MITHLAFLFKLTFQMKNVYRFLTSNSAYYTDAKISFRVALGRIALAAKSLSA
jgi:hypothetical protein